MMLLANTLFEVVQSSFLPAKTFRLLAIDKAKDLAAIISTDMSSRYERPRTVSLTKLSKAQIAGDVLLVADAASSDRPCDEDLTEQEIGNRDNRHDCISRLVENESFIWDYAGPGNTKGVSQCANEGGVSRTTVYFWLTNYYRNGQTRNALLSGYSRCGGPGKEKKLGDKKVGIPVRPVMGSIPLDPGLNVRESEKRNIRRVIMDYYATEDRPTLEEAYGQYKDAYCEDEVLTAAEKGEQAAIITRNQFVYWAHRRCDWNEVCRLRHSESNFESNHRGLNSTVRSQVSGAGERFETDSTPAPVHLVAADNRHDIIGKPNAYLVVDEFTTFITGVHSCLEAPSWRQSAQAFTNAFCDKVAYCARYGIAIEPDDWPSIYLPQRVLCDRGENISEAAESECNNLGITLQFPPPYRGDLKPIVERYWKTTADEFWHKILGTTKSKPRERGQSDPRLDAVLNFQEFTRLLILFALKLNKYRQKADLVTPEMIERNITPTPLNAWRLCLENHAHSLSVCDEAQVRSQLMTRGTASVTSRGIKFRGIQYTCAYAEENRWYEKARRENSWSVETRYDESWSSEIYIRIPESKKLVQCIVRDFEQLRADKSFADVTYIDDFVKRKERLAEESAANIHFNREVEETVENAVQEKARTPKPASKAAQVRNIRDNRRREIESQKASHESEAGTDVKQENHRPELLDALRKGPCSE